MHKKGKFKRKFLIYQAMVFLVFFCIFIKFVPIWTFVILAAYSGVISYIVLRMLRLFLDMAAGLRHFAMKKTDIAPHIPLPQKTFQEMSYFAHALSLLIERLKVKKEMLLEERGEKELIFESLVEGILIVDGAGNLRYLNHIAAQMLSLPRRQAIGKPFLDVNGESKADLQKKCQSVIKLAIEQGNIVTDAFSSGEGQKVHLDLIGLPKQNHKGAVLVIQDKSNHFKVVEMGKDFIANASHELRTPITIIKGFAETLQDLPNVSRPMLKEITEKIVRNCHRMDTLVRNLLTLADIEYVPEHRFQQCDIVAMADNCRHLLLTLSPNIQIDIEKNGDRIMADADPDLLELALMNLLENGVKYSTPPAHLTIFIKHQQEEVHIAIQDRGIGIPKDDLPHVFDRFYTVDKAHSRRLGGAGLGLSIVKTIIDKHDGSINASSVLGQGTTFTITLPVHRQAFLASVK